MQLQRLCMETTLEDHGVLLDPLQHGKDGKDMYSTNQCVMVNSQCMENSLIGAT